LAYINSKKYGSAIQLYHKANGDISYYITYKDENNKLKRIKIGDKSKGITEPFCNQKRNEVINAIRLGDDVPIKHKKQKITTFDEIAQKYIQNLELHSNEQTIKDVKNKYSLHIKQYLGDKNIEKISVDDLETIQREKIVNLSEKTVNMLIDLCGTIINFGINKELCKTTNPASKIKRFKIDNKRDRYLETQEINALYDYIKDDKLLTLFVRMALSTGGRLETLLSIQKKDINLNSKTVNLYDLKNKTTYNGFLTDDTVNILKPFLSELKVNDFVISLDGKRFTARQIQSRLKPKLDKLFNADLDKSDRKNRVVIHSLRHTFASHLAINGTPIFTIQKLMNHRDIKQTLRYAKLAPDSGKEYVNDLYK